jgi:hypothetical protein
MPRLSLFLITLLLLACQPKPPEQATDGEIALPSAALQVVQPNFHLQDQAGEAGRPLQPLLPGTKVHHLGQTSNFTTRLRIGGAWHDAPWLLVQLEDGQQGWVYAAAFDHPELLAELDWQPRLAARLGRELATSLIAYHDSFDTLRHPESLARQLEWGHQLRDSITAVLSQQSVRCPDLPWPRQALPLLALHQAPEHCYVFLDYRPFLAKAAEMPDRRARRLVEVYLAAFPEDSIEYFFPAWIIADGTGQPHSLLGRGLHQQMLERMEEAANQAPYARIPLRRLRQALLDDLLRHDVTYWESQEKATAELAQILAAGFRQWEARDTIALRARLQQFAAPEKYQIQFDHRTGIYQLDSSPK